MHGTVGRRWLSPVEEDRGRRLAAKFAVAVAKAKQEKEKKEKARKKKTKKKAAKGKKAAGGGGGGDDDDNDDDDMPRTPSFQHTRGMVGVCVTSHAAVWEEGGSPRQV
jgi:hypothetical protein